jgi:hypothetical protein
MGGPALAGSLAFGTPKTKPRQGKRGFAEPALSNGGVGGKSNRAVTPISRARLPRGSSLLAHEGMLVRNGSWRLTGPTKEPPAPRRPLRPKRKEPQRGRGSGMLGLSNKRFQCNSRVGVAQVCLASRRLFFAECGEVDTRAAHCRRSLPAPFQHVHNSAQQASDLGTGRAKGLHLANCFYEDVLHLDTAVVSVDLRHEAAQAV